MKNKVICQNKGIKEFITQFNINHISFIYQLMDSKIKFKYITNKEVFDIISSIIENNTDITYEIMIPSCGAKETEIIEVIEVIEILKDIKYKHIKEVHIHYCGNLEQYKQYIKNMISKKVYKKIIWIELDETKIKFNGFTNVY